MKLSNLEIAGFYEAGIEAGQMFANELLGTVWKECPNGLAWARTAFLDASDPNDDGTLSERSNWDTFFSAFRYTVSSALAPAMLGGLK